MWLVILFTGAFLQTTFWLLPSANTADSPASDTTDTNIKVQPYVKTKASEE